MLKQTYSYLAYNLVVVVFGFLTLPIFTHYLSPEDFGVIAIYYLFGSFLSSFLSLGLMNATYRFSYDDLEKFKIINFTNFISIILFFLLGYFFLSFFFDKIASAIFENKVNKNILILSYIGGCLLRLYIYFLNFYIHQDKSKTFCYLEIAYKSLAAILSIILFLFFSKKYFVNDYLIIIYSSIFTSLVMLIVAIYLNRSFLKMKISFESLKKSIIFCYPSVVNEIPGQIQNSFDKIYLNKFSGLYDLGLLDIANKFGNLTKIFINSFANAWTPYFMNNHKKDNMEKLFEKYLEIIILTGIISILFTIFSEEIVITLTNEKFFFIKYYVPIIILNVFIGSTFSLIFKIKIFREKKLHLQISISFIEFALNILLNIIFIPLFGIWGLLISLVTANTISSLYSFYIIRSFFLNKKNFFLIILIYISIIPIIYYLMYLDVGLIIKLILKVLLLFFYFLFIIKLKLIKFKRIKELINKSVKLIFN